MADKGSFDGSAVDIGAPLGPRSPRRVLLAAAGMGVDTSERQEYGPGSRPLMRVAILTPDPIDPSFTGRWSQARDCMAVPLLAEGIEVESLSWIDDPAPLAGFDLVLPLVAWGIADLLWRRAEPRYPQGGGRGRFPRPAGVGRSDQPLRA
jgi:hypothetical protein